jgi:GT2 family glycosyltransferase/2-polyprenyl-3-methyl-5-hydroxy-6-metoxy-1,4-benzoquinol methylase/glycosyltransferase involved in cell wall biosynthesis
MSVTEDASVVNSRAWWDDYLEHHWESHNGSARTEYFMRCIVEHLPPPETYYLAENGATILDWGCAFGEGVNYLGTVFGRCRVRGLDFSPRAVSQAANRFRQHEFILSEKGRIQESFDVITISNCLEHFEKPLDIARQHLAHCRNLYLILVPYAESPLQPTHVTQFTEESFPEEMAGFQRIAAQVIDGDPQFWSGRQLLVIYASPDYLRQRPSYVRRVEEREKWNNLYRKLPAEAANASVLEFGEELAEQVAHLVPENGSILEAGCGAGWQTLSLARTGKYKLSLMDFSAEALRYSANIFQQERVQAEFIRQDAFVHGEPKYDLVFNAGVLEHYDMDEQAELLRAMASWSRRYVMVLVPNRLCYWYWIWRLQAASVGDWPFGKEVPLSDLSKVFQLAGMKFVGQRYCATKWPEGFLNYLPGLGQPLRETILAVHRSGIIPPPQSGYLVAGLGCKSDADAVSVSVQWSPSRATENGSLDKMTASLADALALSVAAEHRDAKTRDLLQVKEAAFGGLTQQLEAQRQEAESLRSRLRAMQTSHDQLQCQLQQCRQDLEWQRQGLEVSQQLQLLQHAVRRGEEELRSSQMENEACRAELAQAEERVAALTRDLARQHSSHEAMVRELQETRQLLGTATPAGEELRCRLAQSQATIDALTRQLHDCEKAGQEQLAAKEKAWSERFAAKEWELTRIVRSRGWRLLQFLYAIRLWLLPHASARERLVRAVYRRLRRLRQSAAIPLPAAEPPSQESANDSPLAAKFDVFCFSIINWDFRFQRPQQLARQFARDGHRVFYVSQRFVPGQSVQSGKLEENVFELSLPGSPACNVYKDSLSADDVQAMAAAIDRFRLENECATAVLFLQLPFWTPLAETLRERLDWPIVYDCMDDHGGFSTNGEAVLREEQRLLANADLTVVSSAALQEKARKTSRRVTLIRNAADYQHFAQTQPVLSRESNTVIGYYGAIADWFDSDLVADLAELHPDWEFRLVGNTFSADLHRLGKKPNVVLLGEKPYAELPSVLSQWHACIIPFKRIPLTEATNPVKIYEMLSAGMPVVAVDLPELRPIAEAKLIATGNNAREFSARLQTLLERQSRREVSRRQAFARENTWAERYQRLHAAIVSLFPKATIPILFHNNLEMNRLCIESIFRGTDWPNYELVLVDNASTDGSRQYAQELAARHANVKVVLNARNESFARANNVALREVSGDYVVFLNNDTIVTRGWITRLIRRLRRDPSIGMVGPVSNAVGNEAQIEASYVSIEGIAAFAARYCREHDGQDFEIPMLALFCAAMRRDFLDKLGGLDERYETGMFEDDDLAMRVKAEGYRIVCAEDVFIHHFQQGTFKLLQPDVYRRIFDENRRRFEAKWGAWKPHQHRRRAA